MEGRKDTVFEGFTGDVAFRFFIAGDLHALDDGFEHGVAAADGGSEQSRNYGESASGGFAVRRWQEAGGGFGHADRSGDSGFGRGDDVGYENRVGHESTF